MSKETGGTAFPFVSNGGIQMHQYCEGGMTLRDYFAAKAMKAILSNPQCTPLGFAFATHEEENRIAKLGFVVTDAMLKARSE